MKAQRCHLPCFAIFTQAARPNSERFSRRHWIVGRGYCASRIQLGSSTDAAGHRDAGVIAQSLSRQRPGSSSLTLQASVGHPGQIQLPMHLAESSSATTRSHPPYSSANVEEIDLRCHLDIQPIASSCLEHTKREVFSEFGKRQGK